MVVPVAAIVRLWGREVGAVAWDAERNLGAFEFTPDFPASGYDLAPLQMPLDQARGQVFEFPTLSHETFRGLPGLLADALPDKFGNTIILNSSVSPIWKPAEGEPSRKESGFPGWTR
jgi:serine/threonine-protein kinase HipA